MTSSYDAQSGRDMPSGPAPTTAQVDSDDEDVIAALAGLAGLVSDVNDLSAGLAHIAEFAVLAIPGADGAGVTLVRSLDANPAVLAWAATKPFVREIDHLQYDVCHEGPCLTAMRTGRALISGSIGSDDRWPRFGGRVARLNVHSALSLPLLTRNAVVGALNIYAYDRDTFTEHAQQMAERFAGPASVSLGNIQLLHAAHDRATHLQTTIASRAVIDQAIGIIRSRTGGSAQDAFNRLKQISQSENVKLAIVAQRLVDDAVRRAHTRHPPPDAGR